MVVAQVESPENHDLSLENHSAAALLGVWIFRNLKVRNLFKMTFVSLLYWWDTVQSGLPGGGGSRVSHNGSHSLH